GGDSPWKKTKKILLRPMGTPPYDIVYIYNFTLNILVLEGMTSSAKF
ncbi:hypothetical protein LCGC14_1920000, partial [marine sediment metagenome]